MGLQAMLYLIKINHLLRVLVFLYIQIPKKFLAGCNGAILYIDSLWADEALRHQDLGTRLITSAECLGKVKRCLFATVNTMDWEALGFYQKLGCEIEFKRMFC